MSRNSDSANNKILVGKCIDLCNALDSSIKFKYTPNSFQSIWDFTDKLTKFIASYYCIFSLHRDYNSLLFIINEIVENAFKYSKDKNTPIEVEMNQCENNSILSVTNEVSKETFNVFLEYATTLLNSDLINLYSKRIEDLSRGLQSNGIGLILLRKDYNVDLCFEFKQLNDRLLTTVTAVL